MPWSYGWLNSTNVKMWVDVMVSLFCENGERYLRQLQAYRRKEIGCAQIIQIDASALNCTGVLVNAPFLNIKVFHQRHTGEEGLAGCQ